MRTPIKSETEAFRFAVGTALVVGVSVLIGWLAAPLIGVAVFAFLFAVAAIAYLAASDPDRMPLRRAARQAPRRPGERHVLVIANEPLGGEQLRDRIAAAGDGGLRLDILAPVLTSRVHWAVTDVDDEMRQARERLRQSLRWAREQGFRARGETGDSSASVLAAIEDQLRDFGADEVIVVTHPKETWQERTELERLCDELEVPVVHLVGEA